MGQRQFVKVEEIRAYYDESNKDTSDYDQILPITVFDAVRENYDDGTVNLTTIINLFKTQLKDLSSGKQNVLQPGTSGHIAIFTGQDGVLGEMEKTDIIEVDPTKTSPNKLVSEKAITDFHENVLKPEIADAAGLKTRVAKLEGDMTSAQDNITGITGRITTAEGKITNLDTKTSKTDTALSDLSIDYNAIKAIVTAWNNTVLNPNGGVGSFKELQDKVASIDSATTKTSNFGDGKYVKSIGVKEIGKNEVSISHEIDNVSGSPSDVKTTVVYSSDNSVNIELMTVGNNDTIDITTDISRDEFNTKLDKNDDIIASTATKVIYDAKGLVTGKLPLIATDIPNISITQVTDLQLALDGKTNVSDFNTLKTKVDTKADQATVDTLNAKTDTKVTSNEAITAGTSPKVTYDAKGLVTGGSNLIPADIPNIDISKVNDLQTALDGKTNEGEFDTLTAIVATKADKTALDAVDAKANTKVTANDKIIEGTGTKITYDAKGLVIAGTVLSATDIPNITIAQVTDLPTILDSKADDTDITNLTTIVNTKASQASVDLLNAKSDTKITANKAITAGTATKITYDSNGLVTGGETLDATDIPNITISQVNNLQANLDGKTDDAEFATLTATVNTKASQIALDAVDAKANTKVDANTAITAATGIKITYDEKGLVTASTNLVSTDIPNITIDQVDKLQTSLDIKTNITDFTALTEKVNTKADQTVVDTLNTEVDTKVTANVPITGKTATKVTYDAKGLVVDGASLSPTDIPTITIAQVDKLQPSLDSKTNNVDFKTLSDTVDTKADKSTVNDLELVVDGKANSTALTELTNVVSKKADISQINALDAKIATKITANPDITPAVATKVAFDKHGLITSTSALVSTDIPDIAISQVAGLEFALEDKATVEQFNIMQQSIDGMISQSELDALHTVVDTKLDKNPPITAGTGMKLTYDSKGLIVGKVALNQGDIPDLAISKIIDLQTELDQKVSSSDFSKLQGDVSNKADQSTVDVLTSSFNSKVTGNAPITAKTGTKISYDSKGLVTGSTSITTADLPADFTSRVDALELKSTTFATETELTNLAAIVNLKVVANEKITEGTATKITYDEKGLVVSGTVLSASDIPTISISQVSNLQTTLDGKTDDSEFTALTTTVATKADQTVVDALNTEVDTKVTANKAITEGTSTKVTYDAKGLVIGGTNLVAADIPNITISQVTDLQSALDSKTDDAEFAALSDKVNTKASQTSLDTLNAKTDTKVTSNEVITAGTATKVTFDAKGLVTAGTILSATDIPNITIDQVDKLQTSLDGKTDDAEFAALSDKVDTKADKTALDAVDAKANTKITANEAITAGIATKVTYDSNGLVIEGTTLVATDIPNITIAQVDKLQTSLDGKTDVAGFTALTEKVNTKADQTAVDVLNTEVDTKVTANEKIDAATGIKITYDEKGLVTGSTNLVATDIPTISISQVSTLQATLDSKTDGTAFVALKATVDTKADNSRVDALNDKVNTKVTANDYIDGATHTKVTYDTKGLVTGGTDLVATDIPTIAISQVDKLQGTLDTMEADTHSRVIANKPIVAATGTKVTYDAKGLITGSEALVKSDLPELVVNDITGLQTALGTKTPYTAFNDLSATVATKADQTVVDALNTEVDTKVTANKAITAGTATKVTYDEKGLVTAGESLIEVDIPALSQSKIVGLIDALKLKADDSELHTLSVSTNNNTAAISDVNADIAHINLELQGKVDENPPITAGSYTKVVVDVKGLVTHGTTLAATDIPDIAITQVTGLQSAIDSKADASIIPGLQTAINNRVVVNPPITAGTATKVTFDAKGLITQATYLSPADIPIISTEQVNGLDQALKDLDVSVKLADLQSQVNTKITANADITGSTGTKITYDAKGLVTGSSNITTADLPTDFTSKVDTIETTIPTLASKESLDNLTATVATKVISNEPITAGVAAKVKFDTKGLIIGTDILKKSDLPAIGVDDIVGLPAALIDKATVEDLVTLTNTMNTKAVQTSVDNINSQLTTINTTLVGHSTDIADLVSKDTELGTNISHVKDDLAATDIRVTNNTNTLAQTEGDLDNIKKDLYGTDGTGQFLKTRLAAGNNVTITQGTSESNLPQVVIGVTIPQLLISQIEELQFTLDSKATKASMETLSVTVGTHTTEIADINSTLATKADHKDVVSLTDVVSNKVDKNAPIVANTGTKITYDAKGLVTSSTGLTKADLPTLGISDIANLHVVLDTKADKTVVDDLGTTLQATNSTLSAANIKLTQVSDDVISITDDLYGLSGQAGSKYLKDRLIPGDHINISESVVDGLEMLIVSANLSDRVVSNAAITAGTATKITYDAKGLVTGSANLVEADIPMMSQYKVTGLVDTLTGKADTSTVTTLQGIVDTKVNKHDDITPGTATKVSFDKQGLITSASPLMITDLPEIDIVNINGLQAVLDAKMNRSDISLSVSAAGNLVITWDDEIV